MQENIKNATDMAFSDNVADMQGEIESALQYKIINALEQKRIEIAMGLMQNEAECSDDDMEDSDDDEDSSEDGDKEDKKKGKKSVKEEYIEEKLSVSDGVDKWIHDFVHSDDPRFEGKSKKERIQMALGAFYAAKKGTNEEIEEGLELHKKKPVYGTPPLKGTIADDRASGKYKNVLKKINAKKTKNEEIEDLDELYSGTMKSYVDKKQQLVGNKRDAGISLAKKKIAKIENQKKKYINARQWEEEVEELDEISAKVAYEVSRKRSDRAYAVSPTSLKPDPETYQKEREKSEKTYQLAKKRGQAENRKNPRKPFKADSAYPDLGDWDRKSGQSGSN